MNDHLTSFLDELDRADEATLHRQAADVGRRRWLAEIREVELGEMLAALQTRRPPSAGAAAETLLSDLLASIWRPLPGTSTDSPEAELGDAMIRQIVNLHKHLGGGSTGRHHLLRMLAECGNRAAFESLADLLVAAPPDDSNRAAVALSPLFRRARRESAALFPRLLDAVGHLSVAAPVLDLANFLFREQAVEEHPARTRAAQLRQLLGDLVQRLNRLEEQAPSLQSDAQRLQTQVAECVALAVALCDALALIGDDAAAGKLFQALELRHRRIRTEAAAALARLGEQAGIRALLEMAAEPVARLRVLAYAEELDLIQQVDAQFATPAARAEAELALWLAQPGQFGLPPTRLELIDQRMLSWPGYDQPIECFLFHYGYELGAAALDNIGIAGPATHTSAVDLTSLEINDLYALFAGWQAEHEHIFQFDVAALDDLQRSDVHRLKRRLQDAGYQDIEPEILGIFFGTKVLAGRASYEGLPGVVAADAVEICWLPRGDSPRPIGPSEVYQIYKGRRLLRSFNE